MKDAKEEERETLRNEQNNPGGKMFFNQKTQILRRVEGQQPQNTRAVFFVVPLVPSWSPIVFVYLIHCKSVTHLVFFTFGVLFFFFLVVVFRFLFPFLPLLCSLFLIQLFFSCSFSLCDPKPRSNYRISEMLILMFCFGACILARSLGPAKNPYSAQRTTPQNGICFIFMALNNVLNT